MSTQLPPIEDLPIFDNSVFTRGSEALTYDVAITEFLAFPSAQGTEQLLNTNVIGDLTVANVIFPSGEKQLNSAFATFNETTSSSTVSYTNTKYLNSTINFTSNQNTTINLPIPVIGSYLKIFNNCQYYATLNIDGTKTFTGEWGNSDPTIRLNPNSWSLLYATTTTGWNIIDRSANQIFDPLTISANTPYEPHYNLLNSTVYFNPTGNFEVTIPNPQAVFSRNKYITIENSNLVNNLITLRITVGLFSGTYGSEATTLLLPSNSSISLYSNGTNWICDNVSSYGWTYPISTSSGVGTTTINMVYQWFRNYIHVNAQNAVFVLPPVKPTAQQEGLVIYGRKILGLTSTTTPIIVRANALGTGTAQTLFILNNAQGSFPANGNFNVGGSGATSYNSFTLRVFKSAIGGSGTCTVNSSNPKMIYLNPTDSIGSFNVGQVLTIGGNNYTIRGMGGASAGAIVATVGTNTIVSYNPSTNFSSFITVGHLFSVTGDVTGNVYTVTSISYTTVIGNNITTYGAGTITFTPSVPTGGWIGGTTNILIGATFGGYTGGSFSTGVYYVEPAISPIPTESVPYTSASAYSWGMN